MKNNGLIYDKTRGFVDNVKFGSINPKLIRARSEQIIV
jgi:hypothetical protein